ncbi:MAG: SRPBCC domain-containing protein [Flavobacteriales bacterium]|nr:SRPBCC domain-containing protein [Flavobacteriales bacterium]
MKAETVTNTIEKTQWFPHSIDKVWKALTETEQVSQWLAPTDFKGKKGAKYALHSPKDDCSVVEGIVKEASPYTLTYSWIALNHKEVETEVKWNLTEENNGTTVNMIHSGMLQYEKQAGEAMFASFSGGWERCFTQIADVLNQ